LRQIEADLRNSGSAFSHGGRAVPVVALFPTYRCTALHTVLKASRCEALVENADQSRAIGPEPHPDFVAVFVEAAVRDGDGALERAGEDVMRSGRRPAAS
jgi:hypothetical protein